MKRKPLVYISGPLTDGLRASDEVMLRNATIAESVAIDLMKAGFAVICPHSSARWERNGELCHAGWIEHDCHLIDHCDIVLRLQGASAGADSEVAYSKTLTPPPLLHYWNDCSADQNVALLRVAWDVHEAIDRHLATPRYGRAVDIAAIIDKLRTVLLAKNADYGDSACARPVLAPHIATRDALLCRMSDKVNRIARLARHPAEVAESLADTVLDLAGYCVLWLVAEKAEDDWECEDECDCDDDECEVDPDDSTLETSDR